jgi:hypothetical protein
MGQLIHSLYTIAIRYGVYQVGAPFQNLCLGVFQLFQCLGFHRRVVWFLVRHKGNKGYDDYKHYQDYFSSSSGIKKSCNILVLRSLSSVAGLMVFLGVLFSVSVFLVPFFMVVDFEIVNKNKGEGGNLPPW